MPKLEVIPTTLEELGSLINVLFYSIFPTAHILIAFQSDICLFPESGVGFTNNSWHRYSTSLVPSKVPVGRAQQTQQPQRSQP